MEEGDIERAKVILAEDIEELLKTGYGKALRRMGQSEKIVVIDGQGGRMGKSIIEQLKKLSGRTGFSDLCFGDEQCSNPGDDQGRADFGATGENPMIVNCKDADMIIGPIGILIADSLLGEITPAMAVAVGSSSAYKIFNSGKPLQSSYRRMSGSPFLGEYLQQVCQEAVKQMKNR